MRAKSRYPTRKSIRLKGYNYSSAGVYFVTVCTAQRRCILGVIDGGRMVLNEAGRIVEREWLRSSEIRPELALDAYVIMPNHFHGLFAFTNPSPAPARAGHDRQPQSVSSFVSGFKGATCRGIRMLLGRPDFVVWQRGFFERVVRGEREIDRFRHYIENNPVEWVQDRYYASASR
ncbi:MAG: transposase [Myxococcales bacterium]|jgi:putative transposase